VPESQPVYCSWSIAHDTIILIFPSAACTSNCASPFIVLLVREQLLTNCLSPDRTSSHSTKPLQTALPYQNPTTHFTYHLAVEQRDLPNNTLYLNESQSALESESLSLPVYVRCTNFSDSQPGRGPSRANSCRNSCADVSANSIGGAL
jgi:hypothetical protein